MVKFEVGGKKFVLKRSLFDSEVKAIENGSNYTQKLFRNIWFNRPVAWEEGIEGKDPLTKQYLYELEMKGAAISKCFGIPDEEVGKMTFQEVKTLFDQLVDYSKPKKW